MRRRPSLKAGPLAISHLRTGPSDAKSIPATPSKLACDVAHGDRHPYNAPAPPAGERLAGMEAISPGVWMIKASIKHGFIAGSIVVGLAIVASAVQAQAPATLPGDFTRALRREGIPLSAVAVYIQDLADSKPLLAHQPAVPMNPRRRRGRSRPPQPPGVPPETLSRMKQ